MTDKEKQVLNEKLARWAGNCPIGGSTPNFTDSLDDCFKWIVSKLKDLGWMARVQYSPLRDNDTGKLLSDWTGYASVFYVEVGNSFRVTHWATSETPALALCLAIEKLIDSKEITKDEC